LGFAGIDPVRVAMLPVEQHFAEKIHAYSYPREKRPFSRIRDLEAPPDTVGDTYAGMAQDCGVEKKTMKESFAYLLIRINAYRIYFYRILCFKSWLELIFLLLYKNIENKGENGFAADNVHCKLV